MSTAIWETFWFVVCSGRNMDSRKQSRAIVNRALWRPGAKAWLPIGYPIYCIQVLHFLFLPASFCPVLEYRGVDLRACCIYYAFLLYPRAWFQPVGSTAPASEQKSCRRTWRIISPSLWFWQLLLGMFLLPFRSMLPNLLRSPANRLVPSGSQWSKEIQDAKRALCHPCLFFYASPCAVSPQFLTLVTLRCAYRSPVPASEETVKAECCGQIRSDPRIPLPVSSQEHIKTELCSLPSAEHPQLTDGHSRLECLEHLRLLRSHQALWGWDPGTHIFVGHMTVKWTVLCQQQKSLLFHRLII